MLSSDGSEYSEGAERVAFAMVEKCGGTLLLASVVITNPEAEAVAPERIQEAEQETRALLDRLHADAVRRGIDSETVFLRGPDPDVEIVAAAEKHGADVIVVGRRAERGLMKRMIGDATTKVVGAAKCSVLVVPEGAHMWRKRILLATDGSRFSDAAAVAASKIAQLCKVAVTVISTIRESFNEERAAQADDAATRVHEHLAGTGLEVDKIVLRGDPDKLILETAAAREADLIVMGTHGRTGWERVLVGSVTQSVIGQTRIPVLAVKL